MAKTATPPDTLILPLRNPDYDAWLAYRNTEALGDEFGSDDFPLRVGIYKFVKIMEAKQNNITLVPVSTKATKGKKGTK